ncbi:hypothetical protein P3T36_005433 [Kitasatospora sp. MAP12-15]|nr:hypothetical protein [Kitasatospora sp. MAP12-44]
MVKRWGGRRVRGAPGRPWWRAATRPGWRRILHVRQQVRVELRPGAPAVGQHRPFEYAEHQSAPRSQDPQHLSQRTDPGLPELRTVGREHSVKSCVVPRKCGSCALPELHPPAEPPDPPPRRRHHGGRGVDARDPYLRCCPRQGHQPDAWTESDLQHPFTPHRSHFGDNGLHLGLVDHRHQPADQAADHSLGHRELPREIHGPQPRIEGVTPGDGLRDVQVCARPTALADEGDGARAEQLRERAQELAFSMAR